MKKIIFTAIILLLPALAFAQGEDGGLKKPPPKTTSKTAEKPKPSTAVKKPVKKPAARNAAKVVYANLNIVVNQPNSEVFLSDAKGNVLEQDSYLTAEDGSPLELEDIAVGTYTLVVRKQGFHDETRKITVAGNKPNTERVDLRPSVAPLTVSTNVRGANIEIAGAGEYETGIQDLMLPSGKYTVNVYKNGYQSVSREVLLAASGQKQQLDIVLEPFPLQGSLAVAENYLKNRDFPAAYQTARKILLAFPENGRANLMAGAGSFGNSNRRDSVFFLSRAARYGETLYLPVRFYNKDGKGDLQLIAGDLMLNMDSMQFRSPNHPELNFVLAPADVSELSEKVDEFGLTNITLKARGTFDGKTDRRTVILYSNPTALRPSRKELFCPVCTQDSCPCRFEEQAIYELATRWRKRDFLAAQPGFDAVFPPSQEFVPLETAHLSLRLPGNWPVRTRANDAILAVPAGAYSETGGQRYYTHGFLVVLEAADERSHADINEAKLRELAGANAYLKRGATSAVKLRQGNALMTTLEGFSPVSQRQQSIAFYTVITADKKVLSLVTVVPSDETGAYESTFRRILNSISIR